MIGFIVTTVFVKTHSSHFSIRKEVDISFAKVEGNSYSPCVEVAHIRCSNSSLPAKVNSFVPRVVTFLRAVNIGICPLRLFLVR